LAIEAVEFLEAYFFAFTAPGAGAKTHVRRILCELDSQVAVHLVVARTAVDEIEATAGTIFQATK
jgi:hypothetical protein